MIRQYASGDGFKGRLSGLIYLLSFLLAVLSSTSCTLLNTRIEHTFEGITVTFEDERNWQKMAWGNNSATYVYTISHNLGLAYELPDYYQLINISFSTRNSYLGNIQDEIRFLEKSSLLYDAIKYEIILHPEKYELVDNINRISRHYDSLCSDSELIYLRLNPLLGTAIFDGERREVYGDNQYTIDKVLVCMHPRRPDEAIQLTLHLRSIQPFDKKEVDILWEKMISSVSIMD